jgi:radical SAM superfamily enzyme YgiQ (UPF0313 family)
MLNAHPLALHEKRRQIPLSRTGSTREVLMQASRQSNSRVSVLLVGPYDPTCGDYTFLAPPLGVWRLTGVLRHAGFTAQVFDPNLCGPESPERAFARVLAEREWSVIGFSTTGMTLRFDLALVHMARAARPDAVLLAGGMEATFNPEDVLRLAPFDLAVLGEGERPLVELVKRIEAGLDFHDVPGTARLRDGAIERHSTPALTRLELRDAIWLTPYEDMPYRRYWDKLERAYRVGELQSKAEREARLSELRSVRMMTLNYCPMRCTFCSSTNFLNAAQGSTAGLARLDADECFDMIQRIVRSYDDVRTIIFQDDIFVFTSDTRLEPLCRRIIDAKAEGLLPRSLQFISTNRIDAMTPDRLALLRDAGFRVLGFGVENFSLDVLKEFNKHYIHKHIPGILDTALGLGITPFLDMIMTSPRSTMRALAENIAEAYRWVLAGCEAGMYPYVIPFSGSAMAMDPALRPHTTYTRHAVAGTSVQWDQAAAILPLDVDVRAATQEIERGFEMLKESIGQHAHHLPSRVRSLLWIMAAIPVLTMYGQEVPSRDAVAAQLLKTLPKGVDAVLELPI